MNPLRPDTWPPDKLRDRISELREEIKERADEMDHIADVLYWRVRGAKIAMDDIRMDCEQALEIAGRKRFG